MQVQRGLFGVLLVQPPGSPAADVQAELAVLHVYGGTPTLNGAAGDVQVDAAPGRTVRVRVVNTDNAATLVWASGPYKVLAVDGTDVHRPTPVPGQAVQLRPAAGSTWR